MTRRSGIVSAVTLLGLTLAVTLANSVAPGWVRAAGLDVWSFPTVQAEYRQAVAECEEIDGQHDRLRGQIAATEQVITLLIDGGLPLPSALEELEGINRDRPGFLTGLEFHYPEGATPRHRLARFAVTKVQSRLADDPTRLARVAARLTAEFRELTGNPDAAL
jgi:hypothetical protein